MVSDSHFPLSFCILQFGSVFFLVLAVIGLAMVAAEPVEEPMSLLELENVPDLVSISVCRFLRNI